VDQVLGWGLEVELGVGILLLRFFGLTGGVTVHDIRSVFLFLLFIHFGCLGMRLYSGAFRREFKIGFLINSGCTPLRSGSFPLPLSPTYIPTQSGGRCDLSIHFHWLLKLAASRIDK